MGDGRGREVDDESWTDMEEAGPDLVEAVPIRHGMVLAGRYAIEKIIGRGGCGVVVRAHDRDLKIAVAIKIVRADLAGQRVWAERLAREVRLARQIHHPHVCRVFDFQQADGRVFLVMELAEKGTLRDEIRSDALAARPLADRIADARAVALALAAIHAAGIVHRDLTPQNLLRMNDGRLVVSDFGLAVDAGETTSSVHGGTVAYLAPEVLAGGKASAASDVWALGVVMHEIVFGVRPAWKGEAGSRMSLPTLGRKPTRDERAVLEACRACTAKDPARRIATAAEAGRMLTERRRWRLRPALSRRPVATAAALTLVAALTAGLLRTRQRPLDVGTASPSATGESPLIVPTGEPADWTDISTVLVEVPERITCTRLLPNKRTIRFVWGTPPHAEDIDTVTRRRVPSPLVPAAYAEGCPDLSPDGNRLVFQGHTLDGRAFAFLSARTDGKDAVPVVRTAEPTMSSEPTWLADGQTFSYDVDAKHVGIFLVAASRSYVLPEPTTTTFFSMFRYAIGNRIFITPIQDSGEMEVVGFTVPELRQDLRFRVAELGLDLTSAGTMLYYAGRTIEGANTIIEIDLAQAAHTGSAGFAIRS
jgi:serine/threonine-protein kinase